MFKQFIVFGLLLTVALPVWAGKGMVEITSEPLGAKIFLNGQRKGSTPQQQGKALVMELEEGAYKLEAKIDDSYAQFDLYVATGAIAQPVHLVLFRVPEMVSIPAGTFEMGSNDGHGSERPVKALKISAFYMSKYETTFEEYEAFASATGRSKPGDEGWGRGKRPVINVSWNDAVAYAEWLSKQTGKAYRLPTEAEWEYAARGGTTTKYWWGDDVGSNKANCDGCGSQWDNKQTAPVGSFSSNGFGLYDTAGNVWEWTCSEDGTYLEGKQIHCSQSVTGQRVVRGGSWSGRANFVRSAIRNGLDATNRYDDIGFRLISSP
jgi:formylglycine-generating enzyme required for sulfatase activity